MVTRLVPRDAQGLYYRLSEKLSSRRAKHCNRTGVAKHIEAYIRVHSCSKEESFSVIQTEAIMVALFEADASRYGIRRI